MERRSSGSDTEEPQPSSAVNSDSIERQTLVSRTKQQQQQQGTGGATDWDHEDTDPAKVPVNPQSSGRLDFPVKDYEDDMCCCKSCCCLLPSCCYKRRMGSMYVLWETRDKKTGDDKVIITCGAAWQSMLITATLLLGLPLLAFVFLLPSLSAKWWCVRICTPARQRFRIVLIGSAVRRTRNECHGICSPWFTGELEIFVLLAPSLKRPRLLACEESLLSLETLCGVR